MSGRKECYRENAQRGYFGIGIENTKTGANVGTLWRSAYLFGASFIFTIGHRYRFQSSDTVKAWRSIPLFPYESFEDFHSSIPRDCRVVGVELTPDARPLEQFIHPERVIYLLGAEDNGLTKEALEYCRTSGGIVILPGDFSMNVAAAGSIVMYDRHAKSKATL